MVVPPGCTDSRDARAHTCGATDKRFIATASINLTALGVWAEDYKSGEAPAEQVAEEAFDAARRVAHVRPSDPSLREAQRYLDGMFSEYGEAVKLHAAGEDAGERMYRAYGLANFAHEVLAEAQPALQRQGCDVGSLL